MVYAIPTKEQNLESSSLYVDLDLWASEASATKDGFTTEVPFKTSLNVAEVETLHLLDV